MNIFSKEKVNIGRQNEVDLARGIAALNIILCHVGLYLGNSDNTGMYVFSDIIGSEFGAPIFMAMMGISMCYSRHQKPNEMLIRAIKLLLGGYLLSFFRSILPMWILGSIDEWTSVEAFFVIDILQLAGLSFMLIALLKKLKIPSIGIFAISIVMVIVDQFIMLPESISFNSKLLIGIVDLFCPISDWSCFPFLTWFFFPAFGLAFGEAMMHFKDKGKIYGILLPVGLLGVLFVYYQFNELYPNYTSYYYRNNFYYMGIKNALLTLFFIVFMISLGYFLDKVLWKPLKSFFIFLSKNLNTFYIISWIILSPLMHIQALSGFSLNVLNTILMMAVMLLVCAGLTKLWITIKK